MFGQGGELGGVGVPLEKPKVILQCKKFLMNFGIRFFNLFL